MYIMLVYYKNYLTRVIMRVLAIYAYISVQLALSCSDTRQRDAPLASSTSHYISHPPTLLLRNPFRTPHCPVASVPRCAQLVYLNNQAHKDKAFQPANAKALLAQTETEELDEKEKDIRFGSAICSLSILRYLTDNSKSLPMGILARLLTAHDLPIALIALLDKPAWERERDRDIERFQNNQWTLVKGADRVVIGQYAAQVRCGVRRCE